MAAQACSKTQFVDSSTIIRSRDVLDIVRPVEKAKGHTTAPCLNIWFANEIVENYTIHPAESIDIATSSADAIAQHTLGVTSTIYTTESVLLERTASAESIFYAAELAEVDSLHSLQITGDSALDVVETLEQVEIEKTTHAVSTTVPGEEIELTSLVTAECITRTSESIAANKLNYAESITNTLESTDFAKVFYAISITNTEDSITVESTALPVDAICTTYTTEAAEVGASSTSTASAESIVYTLEYTYDVASSGGFLATPAIWAHATHSYPQVDWAYNGVGIGTKEYNLSGKFMENVVLLPVIPVITEGAPQSLIRLEAAWIDYGTNYRSYINDGQFDRPPMKREGATRYAFGKGKTSSRWDLTIHNIDYMESITIRGNKLTRRI